MSQIKLDPLKSSDRAGILDVLRGFALFGVLMDNIVGFSGYAFSTLAFKKSIPTFKIDSILGLGELAFVHGKFYSIFSLLFGIGFSVILVRNEQKGVNPLPIFYRRLLILLLIGCVHLFLLWEGDILVLYALLGFLLPLFRKCSDRTLLIWAGALLVSPFLIDCIKVLFHLKTGAFLENMALAIDKKTGIPTDETFAQYLYKEGSGWAEWRNWQQSGFLYRYSYIIESNRIPRVLSMFLLGFYAGRKLMYMRLNDYEGLFRKMKRWGFIIGVPTGLAMAYFELDGKYIPHALGLADSVLYIISVVPLSLAYISSICLNWIRKGDTGKSNYLAAVGRMALTNYLMQTLLCIFIFYGVGLRWGGNIGPTYFFLIGLGIYALQIIYSNAWFKYFNYGPIEWIWRQLTYGKRLPLLAKK